MADKIYYVIGNSALTQIPNPFYGIESEQYLSPAEINFDQTTTVVLSSINDSSSLNLVLFEPLYYPGGRVDIDKYKEKPRKFSLEGSIIGKTIREAEKFKYYLEIITKYPLDTGGLDLKLSNERQRDVPALYVRKVYTDIDSNKTKIWEIRGLREDLSFSVMPEVGYRGWRFSLTLTVLYPIWEEVENG